MCWEPTRIYTPRDVHKVRVRGSHGVRMCPSDRLWIYEGAIVESWWEYTPKKPFD